MSKRSDEIATCDKRWHENKKKYGYRLPTPANCFFRLPIVRNIRATFLQYQAYKQAEWYATVGIGLGVPNDYDRWILYAIYRGWC